MYKAGELVIVPIDCKLEETEDGHYSAENNYGDPPGHAHPMDSRGKYDTQKSGVYLPHSCGEWVVGGKEEIRALITDLSNAYIKLYDEYPFE